MLPKNHIILGGIFSILLYFVFQLTIFQAGLIFLASFLIDFDHYIFYVIRKKDYSLKNARKYLYELKKPHKPIMFLFHNIEFIILLFVLSYFYSFFWFILVGILLHLFSDVVDMVYKGWWGTKEFSLIRYLILRKKILDRYF